MEQSVRDRREQSSFERLCPDQGGNEHPRQLVAHRPGQQPGPGDPGRLQQLRLDQRAAGLDAGYAAVRLSGQFLHRRAVQLPAASEAEQRREPIRPELAQGVTRSEDRRRERLRQTHGRLVHPVHRPLHDVRRSGQPECPDPGRCGVGPVAMEPLEPEPARAAVRQKLFVLGVGEHHRFSAADLCHLVRRQLEGQQSADRELRRALGRRPEHGVGAEREDQFHSDQSGPGVRRVHRGSGRLRLQERHSRLEGRGAEGRIHVERRRQRGSRDPRWIRLVFRLTGVERDVQPRRLQQSDHGDIPERQTGGFHHESDERHSRFSVSQRLGAAAGAVAARDRRRLQESVHVAEQHRLPETD